MFIKQSRTAKFLEQCATFCLQALTEDSLKSATEWYDTTNDGSSYIFSFLIGVLRVNDLFCRAQ